jgi:protein-S-isoprenylcysteine O-methyltransferase Ste14
VTKDDNPRVRVPPPLIFLALLMLGLLIDRRTPGSNLQIFASVTSGIGGLMLIVVALGLFRTNKTSPEPWKAANALVSDGIYRFSRNPMYLGMAILCLSAAFFFGSPSAVALTLVAIAVIDRTVIVREEAYLRRRFGADYLAYCGKVRRWL